MQERHWNEWGVAERVVILVKQPKDVDDCDNLIVGIKQFSTAASEMASSLWRMVFGDGEAQRGQSEATVLHHTVETQRGHSEGTEEGRVEQPYGIIRSRRKEGRVRESNGIIRSAPCTNP